MKRSRSTAAWEACVKKSIKWCRKNHRPGQSVKDCADGVCGWVRAKYKR